MYTMKRLEEIFFLSSRDDTNTLYYQILRIVV